MSGPDMVVGYDAKAIAWKAAKFRVFELCQVLHTEMRWEFAFNICYDLVREVHKDADVGAGDVELWCKQAYALFEVA